jgi:hypothetical protein
MNAAAPAEPVTLRPSGLLCLFSEFLDDLDVIVKNCRNHRDHIGLDDAGPDSLCAPNAYVDDALKGQIPLPHVHHVFAAPLLQDTDKLFDAAIDREDVADASG